MSKPKEHAYDKHISPLVAQIIKLCKQHKINAAMQFALDYNPEEDSPLYCTTVLPVDDTDGHGVERVEMLRVVMKPQPSFLAMTITSKL